MWRAYLTSNSVAENLAKNRTSVVHASLNARYYSSAQGQFLSEDPVFLGNPSQQNLQDPQSLNSYSYANDNPIVKSDPNGLQVLGGADDVAAFGIAEFLIPVIRAGFVAGTVNTDLHIGANLVQSTMQNGQLSYTANPWDLTNAFGQGLVFGSTAETGAGALSPYVKVITGSARAAKFASQGISAAGVTAGSDVFNGNNDPYKVIPDASMSLLSTFGASRIVGMPRGSDVKSFTSPVFFNGANMSNTARTEVTSQSIQSFATAALSSIVATLQHVVTSLQAQHSQSKSH